MKKKMIFFWRARTTKFCRKNMQFVACETWYSPLAGSDCYMYVDNRLSLKNMKQKAVKEATRERKNGKRFADGYSIGYLTCHDPANKHIQQVLPLQKL